MNGQSNINSALQTFGNETMVGTVSSVNVEERTAKVIFADRADFVSGDLKIMQNTPTITVEKWVENPDDEEKWEYEAHYHCADRKLALGEVYEKGTQTAERTYSDGSYKTFLTSEPDVIKNEKVIKYKKEFTIGGNAPMTCAGGHEGGTCSIYSCPLTGIIEEKKHRETVTVYPWLPYIGQFVLCVFLKQGGGDGFVIGGF
jgi:hypothetical protein